MPKKRIDAEKNKAKIINKLAKSPLATQREIAKDTGLALGTVNNQIKDIEQNGTKSEAIEKIIAKDLSIVELALTELENRLKNNTGSISTRDMISLSDVSAKRYMIFQGDGTDDEGGLKAGIVFLPAQRSKDEQNSS